MGLDRIDTFLEHHGVKGQKWGIRNSRAKVPASGDSKKAHKINGKPLHALTNEELKTVNNRLNLEQNYKRLNPSKVAKGSRAVKGLLGALGVGTTVYGIATHPATRGAAKLGAKVITGGQSG